MSTIRQQVGIPYTPPLRPASAGSEEGAVGARRTLPTRVPDLTLGLRASGREEGVRVRQEAGANSTAPVSRMRQEIDRILGSAGRVLQRADRTRAVRVTGERETEALQGLAARQASLTAAPPRHRARILADVRNLRGQVAVCREMQRLVERLVASPNATPRDWQALNGKVDEALAASPEGMPRVRQAIKQILANAGGAPGNGERDRALMITGDRESEALQGLAIKQAILSAAPPEQRPRVLADIARLRGQVAVAREMQVLVDRLIGSRGATTRDWRALTWKVEEVLAATPEGLPRARQAAKRIMAEAGGVPACADRDRALQLTGDRESESLQSLVGKQTELALASAADRPRLLGDIRQLQRQVMVSREMQALSDRLIALRGSTARDWSELADAVERALEEAKSAEPAPPIAW